VHYASGINARYYTSSIGDALPSERALRREAATASVYVTWPPPPKTHYFVKLYGETVVGGRRDGPGVGDSSQVRPWCHLGPGLAGPRWERSALVEHARNKMDQPVVVGCLSDRTISRPPHHDFVRITQPVEPSAPQ